MKFIMKVAALVATIQQMVMCTEDFDFSCGNNPAFNATSFTEYHFPTLNCNEIGDYEYRRHKMCSTFEVNFACPHTCGSCCQDDPNYTFKNKKKGKMVGCEWILRKTNGENKRVQRYCNKNKKGNLYGWNNRNVRDACASSCDFCFTGAKEVAYEPSGNASATQGKAIRSDSQGQTTSTSSGENSNSLNFGDVLFFQNNRQNNRFLTGSRSGSNSQVRTYPYSIDAKVNYNWQISSIDGHLGCVKYGDRVYLKTMMTNADDGNRDLTGSRNAGNTKVLTYNRSRDTNLLSTYQWIIRGRPGGDGDRSWKEGKGVEGRCIEYSTMVYLQNNFLNAKWLTGSRNDDNQYVYTRNVLTEQDELDSYGWIPLKTVDTWQNGMRKYLKCPAASLQFMWIGLQYIDTGSVTIHSEISMTTSSTTADSWSTTTEFESSITGQIKNLVSSVAGTIGIRQIFLNSFENTFHTSSTKSLGFSRTFNTPGEIWQFQIVTITPCVDAVNGSPVTSTLEFQDMVQTDSPNNEPCCLPGYDIDGPGSGKCVPGSYNRCNTMKV